MAVSVRELFLIVRAQDQASRNLRFVGANLRRVVSGAEAAAAAQKAMNREQMATARVAASSARYSGLQARQAEAIDKQIASQKLVNAEREKTNLLAAGYNRLLAEQQVELARIEALSKRRPGTMIPGGGGARVPARAVMQAQLRGINEEMAASAELFTTKQAALLASTEKLTAAEAQQARVVSGLATRVDVAAASLEGATIAEREAAIATKEAIAAQRAVKWQNIGSFGRALTNLGRTAQFTGGVVVAGLGFAANAAANFSRSTTAAATQAANTVSQTGRKSSQIQNLILKQMQLFPATADEMSKSLYDIFSSTNIQRMTGASKLLTIFNKAAVGGQASLNDVTNAGISIMNAFGKKVSDMPKIMQQFFAAVRFGRMNVTEFTQSMNQIVPAFESAHQSVTTMFTSMAFLTRLMPSQRMAATSLSRAIELLSGTAMTKGLKEAGVTTTDTKHRMLDLNTVIERILKRFPQLAKGANVGNWIKSISNMQGTVQARRALTFLFRDFGQYRAMLKNVTGDQNEFSKSYQALAKTGGVQWQVFFNQIKAVWLEIGRAALPGLLSLGKHLQTAVQWFNSLSDSTKSTIVQLTLTSAVLLIIVGTVGQLVGGILSLVAALGLLGIVGRVAAGFALLASVFTEAGGAAYVLELAMGAFLPGGPIILGLAALAGVIYLIMTHSKSATPHIDAMAKATKDLHTETKSAAKSMSDAVVAQQNMNTARRQVTSIRAKIVGDKADLEAAKKGSWAYSIALTNLRYDEQNLKAATDALTGSQAKLQSSLGGVVKHTSAQHSALMDIQQSLPGVRKEIQQAGGLPAPGPLRLHRLSADQEQQAGTSVKARDALRSLATQTVATYNENEKLAASYNHLVHNGLNPFSAAAEKTALNIEKNRNVLLGFDSDMSKFANNLVKYLGMVPEPGFLLGLRKAPQVVRDSVLQIAKYLHQVPTKRTLNFLMRHQSIDQGVTAIITRMRKMPSQKTIRLLLQHKDVDSQIAAFIIKHRKIPTIKQIVQMEVKQTASDKRKAQQFASRLFLGHQGIKVTANTGEANRKIDQTKKKVNGLKDVTRKVHYNITPTDAAAKGSAVGTALAGGIISGINSQSGAINAAVAGVVTSGIAAGVKAAKAKSPSKETKDKIGKPMAQGVIVGILGGKKNVNKAMLELVKAGISPSLVKQAGKTAMKTVGDAMASSYDEIKGTVQGAFGDIFQGTPQNQMLQTFMGFGGKVPFSAVSGDLKAQVNRFKSWTKALNKLRKRGIPDSLYMQLLAAGPDSLPAVQALESASKSQLRSYSRMFRTEQKLINKASHAAFMVQVHQWKEMGKNAAFGILAGLRSETPAILHWMRHLAHQIFLTFKKHNKSSSPSKLYMEEGKNMLLGLQMGMNSFTPTFGPVGVGKPGGGAGGVHYHLHQNLVRGNTSDEAFLRKSRYHFESRIPRQ